MENTAAPFAVSIINLILRGEVISPTPNPQPAGSEFFSQGFPFVSHGFQLFKGARHSPFVTVTQLLKALPRATISRLCDIQCMTSLAEPMSGRKAFLSIYEANICGTR